VVGSVDPEVLDPRRAPRVPLRLAVLLRHRRVSWRAESDDLGPCGCQVVSPRVLAAGRDVALAIACPALRRTVSAIGRVAWSRAEAPARLGIAFEVPAADRDWFQTLLREDPVASRAAVRAPLRLARDTALRLGAPPAAVADFSADELLVLRAVGAGTTVAALAGRLGGVFSRARSALFSLLARRLVLAGPAPEGARSPPEGWVRILRSGAARGPLEPPPRPPAAQRLYEEGVRHLGGGRIDLAIARFREALALVPGDASLATTLARLERWR
jgi:hypothetical protein